MKVLFTFLTFGKDIFAGMENSLYSLCQGITKTGSIALVYTTSHYGNHRYIDGIRTYRSKVLEVKHFGEDTSQEKEIFNKEKEIIKELQNIIKIENPDCIVAWDPLWGIIPLLNYDFGIDCFLVHHVVQNDRMIKIVNGYKFKNQFAVSESLKKDLHSAGIKGNIDILPNSINMDLYKKLSKKSYRGIRDIICNGRMSPEKGVNYCIQAFNKYLKEINSDARLYLFSGSFPFGDVEIEKTKILDLINKLDINSSVILLPNMKWSEIPSLISQADVSVLPSLRETFGISVLEAMGAKTPVICSNVGNLPSLTEGNALLVKPEDSEEIYKSFVKLNSDDSLYMKIQRESYDIAKEYDSGKIAKIFLKEILG
jgi:glycosyltransferase involved in cell wall biosynthesis